MIWRHPVFVLAALLMSGCMSPAPSAPPSARPTTLKIASWNLEHLAERDGEGCRPRTEADYAALRGHSESLDADVIAFQEVESVAAARRVFDPARYDVVISARPASARGGSCYGSPGQSIRHQAVGFAIRKGVRWTRNPDLSALALGNPDLRWGVDITLVGTKPIRLLAVHLKSGCNSGRSPTDRDCPVLFDQLPIVEGWIDARAAKGETFAVLGDWNRRLAARGDAFYAEIDDADPPGADLALAAGDRAATCKARYREFIDHIVLGKHAVRIAVPDSFEEFRYGGVPEERHPSDHCPISVKLGL